MQKTEFVTCFGKPLRHLSSVTEENKGNFQIVGMPKGSRTGHLTDTNQKDWCLQQLTLQRHINHLKRTGHVMHQQFNIQQLYILPTLYLCVLYLSENKQRLVPLTA